MAYEDINLLRLVILGAAVTAAFLLVDFLSDKLPEEGFSSFVGAICFVFSLAVFVIYLIGSIKPEWLGFILG